MSNCFKKWKENFNLNGASKVHFWKSQWEDFDTDTKPASISTPFIVYRGFLVIYFIVTLCVAFFCSGPDKRPWFFIFLTNWTYSTQTIYAILSFSIVLIRKVKSNSRQDGKVRTRFLDATTTTPLPTLPWAEKVTWVLFNIVNAIPYGVTIIFWVGLFPAIVELGLTPTTCARVSNYFVHTGNALMALIDAFIVATPVQITHFVFPLIFITTYLTFTIIYEVAGGSYPAERDFIYPMLNWKNFPGKTTGLAIGALFVFALFHLVFAYGIFKLRMYAVRKVAERK